MNAHTTRFLSRSCNDLAQCTLNSSLLTGSSVKARKDEQFHVLFSMLSLSNFEQPSAPYWICRLQCNLCYTFGIQRYSTASSSVCNRSLILRPRCLSCHGLIRGDDYACCQSFLRDEFELCVSSSPEEQLAAIYKTWMNPELEFVEQVML